MIELKISVPGHLEDGLKEISSRLSRNLNKAIEASAQLVRSTAVLGVQKGPKTGHEYKRRTVTHRASAAGEYPASWSGTLANSIRINKGYLEAAVGSDLNYAQYLEEGTKNMQPRPFLEPSLEKNEEKINQLIDAAIEASLKD